jgi:fructose/tagatose bisphosphate aldolase
VVREQCLRTAGIAHRLNDIARPHNWFLAVAHYAHQIHERYTIFDLAHAVGNIHGNPHAGRMALLRGSEMEPVFFIGL